MACRAERDLQEGLDVEVVGSEDNLEQHLLVNLDDCEHQQAGQRLAWFGPSGDRPPSEWRSSWLSPLVRKQFFSPPPA